MYMCVCVCVCVRVHTHTHTHTHTHMHSYLRHQTLSQSHHGLEYTSISPRRPHQTADADSFLLPAEFETTRPQYYGHPSTKFRRLFDHLCMCMSTYVYMCMHVCMYVSIPVMRTSQYKISSSFRPPVHVICVCKHICTCTCVCIYRSHVLRRSSMKFGRFTNAH
jgi:hypothetical protein